MSIESVVTLSGKYGHVKQLRAMNFIAKTIQVGNIVSVGALGGWMDFALAVDSTVPVFAIGNLTGVERNVWTTNRLELSLVTRVERLEDAREGSIGLLWIDGSLSPVAQERALAEYARYLEPLAYVGMAAVTNSYDGYDLRQVEVGEGYVVFQFHGTKDGVEVLPQPTVYVAPASKPKPAAKKKSVRRTTKKPALKK